MARKLAADGPMASVKRRIIPFSFSYTALVCHELAIIPPNRSSTA